MTKREFRTKFQKLVMEYCKDNEDYVDVNVDFDYYYNNHNYRVILNVDSEDFSQD